MLDRARGRQGVAAGPPRPDHAQLAESRARAGGEGLDRYVSVPPAAPACAAERGRGSGCSSRPRRKSCAPSSSRSWAAAARRAVTGALAHMQHQPAAAGRRPRAERHRHRPRRPDEHRVARDLVVVVVHCPERLHQLIGPGIPLRGVPGVGLPPPAARRAPRLPVPAARWRTLRRSWRAPRPSPRAASGSPAPRSHTRSRAHRACA